MADEYHENYVGDLALKKGLISPEQLEECRKLKASSSPPKSLARILAESGYLDDSQLGELLKEYRLTVGEMLPDESDPGSIEFGMAAAQQGLVKNIDVWDAIAEKFRRDEGGTPGRLGQILIEQGTLAITDAQKILESQGKKILKCAECGHQYNVREYNPNKEYTCLNCGGALAQPETISSLSVQGTAVDSQTVKQAMDDKFVGREIGGCEILEKLGEGGMGAVYKARHITLNKIVAVKVMSSALMGEVHRKRFLREARAAAQLEHQNIVQVHDTGVAEGYNYIVMQFIDGESIQKKINKKGKFSQKDALRVIRDAASALGFAHRHHMIHRDIKPDNIMLTSDDVVKVADFGLVKSTEIEKDLTGMSQSMLMGTPHYMSPEQFEGKIIDHRTDIYSLGVTLYYMLTGQKPYDGTTPYQIMQGHLQQEFVDPTNLSEDIYPAVSKLVRKMMAREREQRYQTCEEVTSDIGRMLAGFEDGTIATEDFIIVEDDVPATMQAKVPEVVGRRGKTPPVPPAEKKRSALLVVLPVVIVVIAVASVLTFLLLSTSEKNADMPPAAGGPEKPVVTPKKEDPKAKVAFDITKQDADGLVNKNLFFDAYAKWDGFVPRWGEDPWKPRVKHERDVLIQKAIAMITQRRESGDIGKDELEKLREQINKLQEASPNEELSVVAKALDDDLRGQETTDQTTKRLLKEFEEAYKRAQGLKDDGQLKEAREIYYPKYVDSEVSEIKDRARKYVKEIDDYILAAHNRQRKEYTTAEKEAKNLLSANQYAEAIAKYTSFTGPEYIAEISEDAEKKITKINQDWEKYKSTEFNAALQMARDKLDKADYPGAQEHLAPYLKHTNKEFAKAATELLRQINSHQQFSDEMRTVDGLRSRGKYDSALEILKPHASGDNKQFAQLAQEKVMQIRRERHLDKKLIFIDGGKISIGSDEPGDMNPPRTVDIKPFYMDRTEVTNAQYEAFIKDTGHKAPITWREGPPPGNHPVTWVTYKDALAYCKWRSQKEGATYRLPAESEWEYAASYDPQKGRKFVYPWGDKFDKANANLDGETQAVGSNSKDKSPLGLLDMAGNVAEWSTSDDGSGKTSCVVRGGSMDDAGKAQAARVTFRHPVTGSDTRGASIGFRCVREK